MRFRSKFKIQLKLRHSVIFIKKALVNQVCIWIWSFWLIFTVLQWIKTDFKINQFPRFLVTSKYTIQVNIWKWLKLLNSLPFIKKTLVNYVYIRIWSSWLTFTVLQWTKTNFKISQFSRFLLGKVIQVKIWKWLKLRNSVKFIKRTLANHVYIQIWSFWLILTVSQWMKTNFKISQFSRFLPRYAIQVKIWKSLNLRNSFPFIKKTLLNQVYIWISSFWLIFTVLQWMKTNFKVSQFPRFILRSEYTIHFKIWKWLKLLNSVPFI